MIIEKSSEIERLELVRLHEILRTPGPCVTVVLPAYHPGGSGASIAVLLKSNIQDASKAILAQGLSAGAAGELLAPLVELERDPTSLSGSHSGRVIFCSPEVFCQFQLVQPVKPSLTVAGCFAIRRLLSELWAPRRFYILGLSKDSIQLLCCTDGRAEAVALPAGVPSTLREAMAFDAPDHDLENRAFSGGSTGAMHAVRFGTGEGHEKENAHLADFYKLIDRGLQALIHEPLPLMLAGVLEDTSVYRAVNTYPCLAKKGLHGSPSLLFQETDTTTLADLLLRSEENEREAKRLAEAKEHVAASHLSTFPHTIVRAAFDGRVRELYIDQNAEDSEMYETPSYTTWGKEDLFNLAVVETILHRGKAFELPSALMPDGASAFAIMRY